MDTPNYLPNVRHQYEHLPYPHRDPQDEARRLIRPTSERLCNLNHHCYRGRRNFDGFRALIAGGGTGDGTIYLALQLSRHPGARVVHLDLSEASIEIARQRAAVRGLTNIEWRQGSLLDLPQMGFEPFDYINCTGVLHHLADPDAGLRALKAVLHPDGAMGLMVYGRHGRTAVYQMQELMRLINAGETAIEARVANARAVLESLPPTNWFRRSGNLTQDHKRFGDAGVFDLFLHEQDRAYTVSETYEFLARNGLTLLEYAWARERVMLEPETWIKKTPALLEKLQKLPLPERRAAAELLCGSLTRQHVYAAPEADRVARVDDLDNIPFLVDFADPDTHRALADHLLRNPGKPVNINAADCSFPFTPGRHTAAIFSHLDGKTSLGEIFARIRGKAKKTPTDRELLADWHPVYARFALADAMLLRHRSVPATLEVLHGDRLSTAMTVVAPAPAVRKKAAAGPTKPAKPKATKPAKPKGPGKPKKK